MISCSTQVRSTYDAFEHVDLVEEHALLIVVHVALAKHFDGALRARVSVHAHSHFTKGA